MNSITISALLVQGGADRVRLIMDPYCLDFDLDDVLEVSELAQPKDMVPGSAIPAKVTLKPGARLLQIAASEPYRDLLWRRPTPFALSTRADAQFAPSSGLVEREAAFFAGRGLKLETA